MSGTPLLESFNKCLEITTVLYYLNSNFMSSNWGKSILFLNCSCNKQPTVLRARLPESISAVSIDFPCCRFYILMRKKEHAGLISVLSVWHYNTLRTRFFEDFTYFPSGFDELSALCWYFITWFISSSRPMVAKLQLLQGHGGCVND